MLRLRAGLAACLGLVVSLLASCVGAAPQETPSSAGPSGGGDFMGVTRARCAQGDDGACRILHAMEP